MSRANTSSSAYWKHKQRQAEEDLQRLDVQIAALQKSRQVCADNITYAQRRAAEQAAKGL